MVVLIGLLATVIICVQNVGSVLGFGWAAMHDAGPRALFAFLPAAAGIAMLWLGYVFLRRRNVSRMTPGFAIYALCIVLLNEVVLPWTPLKAWRSERAVEAVEVRNVRDEHLLSAAGHPMGIRIAFDVVVPRTASYSIDAAALSRVADDVFWPLDFGHSSRSVIEPPPSRGEAPFSVFQNGVVYTFTTDLTPNFLSYDEREKRPCLVNVTTKYLSEADFMLALSKSRRMKYRGEVHVSSAYSTQSQVAKEYVTAHDYDVEAMYRSIAIEGGRRCDAR
jgi:hypothetical protein